MYVCVLWTGRHCFGLIGVHVAKLLFQAFRNGPFSWHCTSVGLTCGQILGNVEGNAHIHFLNRMQCTMFSEIYFWEFDGSSLLVGRSERIKCI